MKASHKRKSLLVGLLLCLAGATPAQTFLMAYGGSSTEQALCVLQTFDSGYIMSGYTNSFNGSVYVVKTDMNGSAQWKKYFGIAGGRGSSIVQTSDSGYIVGGTAGGGAGISDMLLLKLDKNGDSLWARTYGGPLQEDGFSVQQTADGGYVLAGRTFSFGAGSMDIYLVRTNNNGDTLWTRTYGTISEEEGFGVRETFDKGFIITGSYNGTYTAVYLVKADSTGAPQWGKTYDGNGVDRATHVEQTADSGYIVTGESWSFGPGWGEFLLFKTGTSGDVVWAEAIGGANGEKGTCVKQTTDGGYILTGNYQDGSGGTNGACLVKTNSSGDTLWTRHFKNTANSFGNSVWQTNDGGYILGGGTFEWGAGMWDVLLVKTDSQGNAPCYQHQPVMDVTPATLTVSDLFPESYSSGTVLKPSFTFGSGGFITTICTTVGMDSPETAGLIVYPNPSTGEFSISLPHSFFTGTLRVFNMLGATVFEKELKGEYQQQVGLANVPPGVYVISVQSESNNFSARVLIQR